MAKPAAAPKPAVPPSRRLSNLKMVWRFTLRYPAHLAAAALSLLVAASATLFIPRTFQKVIDRSPSKKWKARSKVSASSRHRPSAKATWRAPLVG